MEIDGGEEHLGGLVFHLGIDTHTHTDTESRISLEFRSGDGSRLSAEVER
jgi:hypothetical protein